MKGGTGGQEASHHRRYHLNEELREAEVGLAKGVAVPEAGDRRIARENHPITPQELAMPQSHSRSEAPNWLLG